MLEERIWYPESKVYHDGSHYIAIPHTKNPHRKRPKPQEQVFVIREDAGAEKVAPHLPTLEIMDDDEEMALDCPFEEEIEAYYKHLNTKQETPVNAYTGRVKVERGHKPKAKRVTRGSEFNRLYEETKTMKKKEQKAYLIKNLRRLFKSDSQTESYVRKKLEDRHRAVITRRIRFKRKAYMNNFNYFVTFTYDDKKHTEETFQKKLKKTLQNFHTRHGWRYMGVWERAPKTGRLHFHGLIYVPDGAMIGELEEKKSYSTTAHKIQKTHENTYFQEHFGRNDFEPIEKDTIDYSNEVGYILKYLEKTGERIMYSRGLPMYVITDIHESDVVVRTGIEDRKLVLFDDFKCFDEGEYVGKMSDETKAKLRKAN